MIFHYLIQAVFVVISIVFQNDCNILIYTTSTKNMLGITATMSYYSNVYDANHFITR